MEAITCVDAEEYYQDLKSSTETSEKVVSSQFSEIKEAILNEIPVQYFTRIYTMAAGNETKDFYCIVDFPAVDNKEYVIVISMPFVREEELLLSGLENFLVDVEIQGVKPGVETEDTTTVKNDETYAFSVSDASSAEEYIDAFLQNNSHLEIGTQEELQLCDRMIHSFHIKEKDSDKVRQSIGVIELASGVVFAFEYDHVNFGEAGFEEVLGAMKFIVE